MKLMINRLLLATCLIGLAAFSTVQLLYAQEITVLLPLMEAGGSPAVEIEIERQVLTKAPLFEMVPVRDCSQPNTIVWGRVKEDPEPRYEIFVSNSNGSGVAWHGFSNDTSYTFDGSMPDRVQLARKDGETVSGWTAWYLIKACSSGGDSSDAAPSVNNLTNIQVRDEGSPFFTLIWKDSPGGSNAAVDLYYYDASNRRQDGVKDKWDNSGWLDRNSYFCQNCGRRSVTVADLGTVTLAGDETLFELVWKSSSEGTIRTYFVIDSGLNGSLAEVGSAPEPTLTLTPSATPTSTPTATSTATPIFTPTATPTSNDGGSDDGNDTSGNSVNNLTNVTIRPENDSFFTLIWKDSPQGGSAAVDVYRYTRSGSRDSIATGKWDNSGWIDANQKLCQNCSSHSVTINGLGTISVGAGKTLFELVWHGSGGSISTYGTIDSNLNWSLATAGNTPTPTFTPTNTPTATPTATPTNTATPVSPSQPTQPEPQPQSGETVIVNGRFDDATDTDIVGWRTNSNARTQWNSTGRYLVATYASQTISVPSGGSVTFTANVVPNAGAETTNVEFELAPSSSAQTVVIDNVNGWDSFNTTHSAGFDIPNGVTQATLTIRLASGNLARIDNVGVTASGGDSTPVGTGSQLRNMEPKFKEHEDTPSASLNFNALTTPDNTPPTRTGPTVFTSEGFVDPGYNGANGDLGDGNFRVTCQWSHFSYDDPIKFPGTENGSHHLHMFFGNTKTDHNSTRESLIASGGGTCNGFELNRSAYWTPALLDGEGNVVVPYQILVYYKVKAICQNEQDRRKGHKDDYGCESTLVHSPDNVKRMKQGLELFADYNGDIDENKTPDGTLEHVFWSCGVSGSSSNTRSVAIPNCGDEPLNATIYFQQCWNESSGDLQSENFTHVDVVGEREECPETHPDRLPRLGILLYFDVRGQDTSSWRLSSDMDMPGTPWDGIRGSTLHADWIGGWHNDTMEKNDESGWLKKCLKETRNCNIGQLGDIDGQARKLKRLDTVQPQSWLNPEGEPDLPGAQHDDWGPSSFDWPGSNKFPAPQNPHS